LVSGQHIALYYLRYLAGLEHLSFSFVVTLYITMKYLPTLFAATAALAPSASAHYIFSKLVLNGEVSEDWQYIRETTRSECYMPTKFTNTFDNLTPNDSDFRCNLGSFSNAAKTEVAEVAAGDTIGMKLFYDTSIAHPGPGQVCMGTRSHCSRPIC
jgi:hypothetical protein